VSPALIFPQHLPNDGTVALKARMSFRSVGARFLAPKGRDGIQSSICLHSCDLLKWLGPDRAKVQGIRAVEVLRHLGLALLVPCSPLSVSCSDPVTQLQSLQELRAISTTIMQVREYSTNLSTAFKALWHSSGSEQWYVCVFSVVTHALLPFPPTTLEVCRDRLIQPSRQWAANPVPFAGDCPVSPSTYHAV
jgi:hypothetical protein